MVSLDGGSACKVDDVTALPSHYKMADMRYYGNVMTTTRWRLYVILHLQQYSRRLNLYFFLLMKHAPLPRVILHAVGIQLDWCWFTIRFYFRGYSDQHRPMSAVTAFPLQSLCIVSYSLMGMCISIYSSFEIYGFCEGEERLQVLCYQFLVGCWPVPSSLDVCLELSVDVK